MARRLRKRYGCPVELALDVLGGKWKTVILARIKDEPLAYGGLRKAIPDLSDKVLSEKLRELTELGLVTPLAHGSLSDRRRYGLTERGRELVPALEALYWAGGELAGTFDVDVAQAHDDVRHSRMPSS